MYQILLLILIFIILSRFELKYIILSSIIIFLYIVYYKSSNVVNNKYSYNISYLLNKLKEYRNINDIEFRYGMKYYSLFTDITNNIINNQYDNPYKKYESAEELLYLSIDHFKSLIIKSDDKELKIYIDSLFKESLSILKKISKILNKSWEDSPNMTKKEIIFDPPKPYNTSFILKN